MGVFWKYTYFNYSHCQCACPDMKHNFLNVFHPVSEEFSSRRIVAKNSPNETEQDQKKTELAF